MDMAKATLLQQQLKTFLCKHHSCYVACNIYITSGSTSEKSILLSLLSQLQNHCRQIRSSQQNNKQKVALVHAYTDIPYERSSFHLVGDAYGLSEACVFLVDNAMISLQQSWEDKSKHFKKDNTRHPCIGLVDHISFMPMLSINKEIIYKEDPFTFKNAMTDQTYSYDTKAVAARYVGEKIQQRHDCNILYYGSAAQDKERSYIPLAEIRKQKTNFFRSGSLSNKQEHTPTKYGNITLGSPSTFTENFNIRLQGAASKQHALSLSKFLRMKRDKGELTGLETLVLPYKNPDLYEVACNLLQPNLVSTQKVLDAVTNDWLLKEQLNQEENIIIDEAYRVGTTEAQCSDVLKLLDRDDDSKNLIHQYDNQVRKRFEGYF